VSAPGDVSVGEGSTLRKVLEVITRTGKQIALVVDADGRLVGVATDGDLRKAILRGASLDAKVDEVMNRNPVVAAPGLGRPEALAPSRSRSIRHLPLLDARRAVTDLLILDDLLVPAPPSTIQP
jgi:CBS domain-containing protein